ncbi:MAG: hypothetical protein K0Q49_509 [Haloplasmataceae bacterium]|jgi:hypothetical protein|nr:hypothetical protein [Haloplasmataceae bacterium]
MNHFFLTKNNYYPSIHNIERILHNLHTLKNSRNKLIDNKYLKRNIRRKSLIGFQFLIFTNEVNKFYLNGIVIKKNKKNNLNNSVTVKSLLSGKQIKINFHLFSNSARLM